jgi:hypothetical protein
VRVPQVMFEVIYETKAFNDLALWPEDGSQPFVYSFGDHTGYANHGDYLFGWKDDSLQKIMDEECFVQCSSMKTQSMEQMNACSTTRKVDEDVGDVNCKSRLWWSSHAQSADVLQGLRRFLGSTMWGKEKRCLEARAIIIQVQVSVCFDNLFTAMACHA